jgi:hypothetical protein
MRTARLPIGWRRSNGSIVVPLWAGAAPGSSADGAARHVVGAYGRKLLDNLRPGTPKHLYLPGPHRGVLNREGIAGQSEAILCEALLDALTFWVAGYRNVTSCDGVSGFTEELLAALNACGAQRILIAFDRDEPGDRAAEALAQRLMAEGFDCFRLLFPKGMDANEYACTVKPAEKSLGVVIRAAQWLGSGTKPALTTRTASSLGSISTPEPEMAAAEILRDTPVLQTEPLESVAPDYCSVEERVPDGSLLAFNIPGYERPAGHKQSPYRGKDRFPVEGLMKDADDAEIFVYLFADVHSRVYELELDKQGVGSVIKPDWSTFRVK